jgi:hypothetical protein
MEAKDANENPKKTFKKTLLSVNFFFRYGKKGERGPLPEKMNS